jgi:hypothetical protein
MVARGFEIQEHKIIISFAAYASIGLDLKRLTSVFASDNF